MSDNVKVPRWLTDVFGTMLSFLGDMPDALEWQEFYDELDAAISEARKTGRKIGASDALYLAHLLIDACDADGYPHPFDRDAFRAFESEVESATGEIMQ